MQKYPFNSNDKMVCRLCRFPDYVTIILQGAAFVVALEATKKSIQIFPKRKPKLELRNFMLKLPESNSDWF